MKKYSLSREEEIAKELVSRAKRIGKLFLLDGVDASIIEVETFRERANLEVDLTIKLLKEIKYCWGKETGKDRERLFKEYSSIWGIKKIES